MAPSPPPAFVGTIYASLGPNTNACPDGWRFMTKDECHEVTAAIDSTGGTPGYDNLLGILHLTGSDHYFGKNAISQTHARAGYSGSRPVGCSMEFAPLAPRKNGFITFNAVSEGEPKANGIPICMVAAPPAPPSPPVEPPPAPLWPVSATYRRCAKTGCGAATSENDCQDQAFAAGHVYYETRPLGSDEGVCCRTYASCDNPVDATNPWIIYGPNPASNADA